AMGAAATVPPTGMSTPSPTTLGQATGMLGSEPKRRGLIYGTIGGVGLGAIVFIAIAALGRKDDPNAASPGAGAPPPITDPAPPVTSPVTPVTSPVAAASDAGVTERVAVPATDAAVPAVADPPVVDPPVADPPVVKKPTVKKPTVKKPTVKKKPEDVGDSRE
nr:hypothetical protein [Myxococcota bacterium]